MQDTIKYITEGKEITYNIDGADLEGITELFKSIPDGAKNPRIYVGASYDGADIELRYERPETSVEKAKRLKLEEKEKLAKSKAAESTEKREKKELERLLKKYGK